MGAEKDKGWEKRIEWLQRATKDRGRRFAEFADSSTLKRYKHPSGETECYSVLAGEIWSGNEQELY